MSTLREAAQALCDHLDAPGCARWNRILNQLIAETRAELAKPDAPAAAPDGLVPVGELEFARHEIADWALYASPYFQEKHDLKGTLDRVDAAISAAAPRPAPAAPAPQPAGGDLPERDAAKPAEQQGLFRKFDVRRTDGADAPGCKHHGCDYFVLDATNDKHAPVALAAYANAVEATHPDLAKDMRSRYALARPPAAKPLLPLTDEQIDRVFYALPGSCCDDITGAEARVFARAIEASITATKGDSHD